jgi:hypothetical protein
MCKGTLKVANSVHMQIHTVSWWVHSAFLSTLCWCAFHSPFVNMATSDLASVFKSTPRTSHPKFSLSLLWRKITKPSSMHTVTGYRILSSRYFVQLTHLQSPNLNTHHAVQTNSTQPTILNSLYWSMLNPMGSHCVLWQLCGI